MNAVGWFGALLMCSASFLMGGAAGLLLGIAGLLTLTIQAVGLRAWNLVALNLVSVAGFCYSLWSL